MLFILNHKMGLSSKDNHPIPLSLHNHVLNDESIAEAKKIAKDSGIFEFNVIQMGDDSQRNPIYFGVVTK